MHKLYQSPSELSIVMQEEISKKISDRDAESGYGSQSSILVKGQSQPGLCMFSDYPSIHDLRHMQRMQMEEVAVAHALERREKNFK